MEIIALSGARPGHLPDRNGSGSLHFVGGATSTFPEGTTADAWRCRKCGLRFRGRSGKGALASGLVRECPEKGRMLSANSRGWTIGRILGKMDITARS